MSKVHRRGTSHDSIANRFSRTFQPPDDHNPAVRYHFQHPKFFPSEVEEVQFNELRREVVSQDDEARRGAAGKKLELCLFDSEKSQRERDTQTWH